MLVMADLFTTTPPPPLAELLRPTSLDDVVGQAHLVGPRGPLRLAFRSGKLPSVVLWGPPGVGKTTLARLAAQVAGHQFLALSAVTAGVKEIRETLELAQKDLDYRQRRTVLFIDEIHRLNKAQQDALLPHVESGLVVLWSATTHNPAFEVIPALLSRAQIHVLKPLEDKDLRTLYERARPKLPVAFDDEGLSVAIESADGDARRFLNTLETVANAAAAAGLASIGREFVHETTGKAARRFDRENDGYDFISAFQKSIRGSNPNGALYWLARMVDAGADPRYIARRLIVMASEDIGNADPRGLEVAVNAAQAVERLGMPEGGLALAQATIYLAVAPKSNASYKAWKAALAFVQADRSREVPHHLRNAPVARLRKLGHGEGYRYAHDEPQAYAAGEHYFPMDLPAQDWYQPNSRGLEVKIGEKLRYLQSLDDAASAQGTARRARKHQ